MIHLSKDQVAAFRALRMRSFAEVLADRLGTVSPDLAKTLTAPERLDAAGQAVRAAQEHGFRSRGPLRCWFDLCAALGTGFFTDPQYPAIAKAARAAGRSEMARAEAMHAAAVQYLTETDGPDNVYTLEALGRLQERLATPVSMPRDGLADHLQTMMAEFHPRKFASSGAAPVAALISTSLSRAEEVYGFASPNARALVAILALCFGHRFDRDPLLPWVARSLIREDDPDARAARLQRRAVTWLGAVLDTRKGTI